MDPQPDSPPASPQAPPPAKPASDSDAYVPLAKPTPIHSPLHYLVYVLALGIIGYIIYTLLPTITNSLSRPSPTPQPLTPITQPPPPTSSYPNEELSPSPAITDEENPWPTYRGPGFTFQYPPAAQATPLPLGEGVGAYVYLAGPSQKTETEFYDGLSLSFKLIDLGDQDLKDYVDARVAEIKDMGLTEITSGPTLTTINGYQGYRYTEAGLGTHDIYLLEDIATKQAIQITNSSADPSDQGYEQDADTVLDSFTFSL